MNYNSSNNHNNIISVLSNSLNTSQLAILDSFENSFWRVWKNKVLLNRILQLVRVITVIKWNTNKHYFDLDSFYGKFGTGNMDNLNSISFGDVGNKCDFLKFIKECPSNIERVEFSNIKHQIELDLKDIQVAPTLKALKLNSGFKFINSDQSYSLFKLICGFLGIIPKVENFYKWYYGSERELQPGQESSELHLSGLPKGLVNLSINFKCNYPITKDMLPNKLISFSLNASYSHSTLDLPSSIKYVTLGNDFKKMALHINQSIISSIPPSCTSLKLLFVPKSQFKPLGNQLAASLKKLIVLNDQASICPQTPFFLDSNLKSLESLDISNISHVGKLYTIDISLLPRTLKKLKLPTHHHLTPPLIIDTSLVGYPRSLTHLSGSQSAFDFAFQDYSNLKSLSVLIYFNLRRATINYSLFPNLMSIRLCITSPEQVFNQHSPLPANLENLEINLTYKLNIYLEKSFGELQQLRDKLETYLEPLVYLKSLKLDSNLSNLLFCNEGYPYCLPNTSILQTSTLKLPRNIRVLYLEFLWSGNRVFNASKSLNLKLPNGLINSLKLLIINSKCTLHFKSKFGDLDYLFISTSNNSTIRNLKSSFDISKIIFFNSLKDYPIYSNSTSSYLYNKLKNIY